MKGLIICPISIARDAHQSLQPAGQGSMIEDASAAASHDPNQDIDPEARSFKWNLMKFQ